MAKAFSLKNGTILLSTEAPGGLYNSSQLKTIAKICDSGTAVVKATEDQRLALLVKETDAPKIAAQLKEIGLGIRNYQDGLHQPITCIGELCPDHEQDALGTSMELTQLMADTMLSNALKIGINGCGRCCVPSHTLDISIVGDSGGYRISLGGKNSQIPEMASFVAEGVPATEIAGMVAKVITLYRERSQEGESLQEVMERVGAGDFVAALAPYSQDASADVIDPFVGGSDDVAAKPVEIEPEEVMSEEVMSEEVMSEEVMSEEVMSEEMMSEEVMSEIEPVDAKEEEADLEIMPEELAADDELDLGVTPHMVEEELTAGDEIDVVPAPELGDINQDFVEETIGSEVEDLALDEVDLAATNDLTLSDGVGEDITIDDDIVKETPSDNLDYSEKIAEIPIEDNDDAEPLCEDTFEDELLLDEPDPAMKIAEPVEESVSVDAEVESGQVDAAASHAEKLDERHDEDLGNMTDDDLMLTDEESFKKDMKKTEETMNRHDGIVSKDLSRLSTTTGGNEDNGEVDLDDDAFENLLDDDVAIKSDDLLAVEDNAPLSDEEEVIVDTDELTINDEELFIDDESEAEPVEAAGTEVSVPPSTKDVGAAVAKPAAVSDVDGSDDFDMDDVSTVAEDVTGELEGEIDSAILEEKLCKEEEQKDQNASDRNEMMKLLKGEKPSSAESQKFMQKMTPLSPKPESSRNKVGAMEFCGVDFDQNGTLILQFACGAQVNVNLSKLDGGSKTLQVAGKTIIITTLVDRISIEIDGVEMVFPIKMDVVG